jgi:hypothetical protein
MKLSAILSALVGLVLGVENLPALEVQEVIGQVTLQEGRSIANGETIADPCVISSGADSRVQLKVGESVIRLGANSVLNVQGQEWRLRRGSVLFVSPAGDVNSGKVQIGDSEWNVEGGIGFANVSLDSQSRDWGVIGSMGDATIARGANAVHDLTSADMLVIPAEGSPRVSQFDLSKQMRTSLLVHGFKSPLTAQADLNRADRRFERLDRRGFIERATSLGGDSLNSQRDPLKREFSGDRGTGGGGANVEPSTAFDSLGGGLGFESRLQNFSHAQPATSGSSGSDRKFHEFNEKKKSKKH